MAISLKDAGAYTCLVDFNKVRIGSSRAGVAAALLLTTTRACTVKINAGTAGFASIVHATANTAVFSRAGRRSTGTPQNASSQYVLVVAVAMLLLRIAIAAQIIPAAVLLALLRRIQLSSLWRYRETRGTLRLRLVTAGRGYNVQTPLFCGYLWPTARLVH